MTVGFMGLTGLVGPFCCALAYDVTMRTILITGSGVLITASFISWLFSAYCFHKLFRSGYGLWVPEVVFYPGRLPAQFRIWRTRWFLSLALWLLLSGAATIVIYQGQIQR